MTRILVTGGAGFIGSWLVEALLQQDRNHVVVVDNLSSNPISYDQWRAEMVESRQGAGSEMFFYRDSVQDYARYNRYEFDLIYHLASPVGPAGILKRRGKMVRDIVNDTYAVLQMARRDHAKLVYVSTSEIYGGGQDGACREEYDRIISAKVTTRLEYAVGKLAGETAVLNTDEVNACIVRPFNVAGPRQSSKGGFVLARFAEQVIMDQPLTVFGGGHQLRAFTHVKDIARGLMAVAKRGEPKGVYNLGFRENLTTINALAEEVAHHAEEVGFKRPAIIHLDGKEVYGPLYEEANDKWPIDVKHEALGWWPENSISQIVHDALEYVRMPRNVLP